MTQLAHFQSFFCKMNLKVGVLIEKLTTSQIETKKKKFIFWFCMSFFFSILVCCLELYTYATWSGLCRLNSISFGTFTKEELWKSCEPPCLTIFHLKMQSIYSNVFAHQVLLLHSILWLLLLLFSWTNGLVF